MARSFSIDCLIRFGCVGSGTTSTGTPRRCVSSSRICSRRPINWKPPRMSSITTATSTSDSALASLRAVDPNNDKLWTPSARNSASQLLRRVRAVKRSIVENIATIWNPIPGPLSRRQLRRMMPGDAAEGRRAADAVLAEAARRVAAGVESRDRPATQVDDLRAGIDADAGIGVVDRRRVPGRVEWRLGDLVHGRRLLEVLVDRIVDEGVVAIDRPAQRLRRHRPPLMRIEDLLGELLDGIGREEITVGIDMRRLHRPALTRDRVGVEDRPDRAATVHLLRIAGPGERRRKVFVVTLVGGLGVEA